MSSYAQDNASNKRDNDRMTSQRGDCFSIRQSNELALQYDFHGPLYSTRRPQPLNIEGSEEVEISCRTPVSMSGVSTVPKEYHRFAAQSPFLLHPVNPELPLEFEQQDAVSASRTRLRPRCTQAFAMDCTPPGSSSRASPLSSDGTPIASGMFLPSPCALPRAFPDAFKSAQSPSVSQYSSSDLSEASFTCPLIIDARLPVSTPVPRRPQQPTRFSRNSNDNKGIALVSTRAKSGSYPLAVTESQLRQSTAEVTSSPHMDEDHDNAVLSPLITARLVTQDDN